MALGAKQRISVYRLGSIGDITVSLPCFNLIRREFPEAHISLITNAPVDDRAAPAMSILDGSGLVDDCISYPLHTRDLAVLRRFRLTLRDLHSDLLVYLVSRRQLYEIWRDYFFFRLCGIGKMIGFPFKPDLRESLPPASALGLWEPEAARLARCIARLGSAAVDQKSSWDLHLTADEIGQARECLGSVLGASGTKSAIGICAGTKQPVKDWGAQNWRKVVRGLADPATALVLVGAADERSLSQDVAAEWTGPVINLCGRTSPRVSAAVLRHVRILLCNDSGPMHLAAAVGTKCVAVFSTHNLPGQWYPFGEGHEILYPQGENASIHDIRSDAVLLAAHRLLERTRSPMQPL